jgi:uncharacterized protein YPO0396
MKAKQPDMALFSREQYRMSLLQVYNWGTFQDRHRVPISEKGFLIVGKSGTGKSTLLDAFSALLIPPSWLDFNAAAREADRSGRDRTFVSYVRGAWAEQKDDESGLYAIRYLRPETTWSALALTFHNESGGTVTLVQICWIRGNSNNPADLRRYYMIFERELDLQDLSVFGENNFDVRKLKAAHPDAFARDEFGPYCERFRMLLGIENEKALRLLHKTQSAKNLGDLNTFLRDFMLDKPGTFDASDQMVREFAELSAAHQAVVTARRQVETLAPARENHRVLLEKRSVTAFLRTLRESVDSFCLRLREAFLREDMAARKAGLSGLTGETARARTEYEIESSAVGELERKRLELGGDRIANWEAEKKTQEGIRSDRLRRRSQAESTCRSLGWSLPDNPKEFSEMAFRAGKEIENWESGTERLKNERYELSGKLALAREELSGTLREVEVLRRQPSNIPAEMQELRRGIAEAIGVAESALPFAGELLQVKADEGEWSGAIERALHGFALSLLVDERHYAALSAYVNGRHLGKRLVYLRTGRAEGWQTRAVRRESLVFKLDVKAGVHNDFLNSELRARFDYACVDGLQAFRAAERALTREGQIKHGPSRHEKDDRFRVDDRRNRVLGFDSREKLALFQEEARKLEETAAKLSGELGKLEENERQSANRAGYCRSLVELAWADIDASPALSRIAELDRLIREAREGDVDLRRVEDELVRRKVAEQKLLRELQKAQSREDRAREDIEKLETELSRVQRAVEEQPGLPENIAAELDVRFRADETPLGLESLDSRVTQVERKLSGEIEAAEREIGERRNAVEKAFAEFRRQWPTDAANLDGSLESAPDFLNKLSQLESDGLPAYEHRFFELLESQSHQNLAALASYLNNERKIILERMDFVNLSLSEVPFNRGPDGSTILRIETIDRQTAEVREFRQEIQNALSHAWNADREAAEARFVSIRKLVERLDSKDPENRRWRESVLDVRLHVEFVGREMDEAGAEVEVYRSGAGKSGGQRQKLATTCLAAALRYQLGGSDHGLPMYAPVVLDEAFDKADSDFTALAMKIFENFGFQMVVATPLKSVMTLEPFIGGACFVDISERRKSGVLPIEYDEDRSRLKLPEPARVAE